MNLQIREFKIEDLNSIGYLQPESWDDIKYYFKFYTESPFCYPIAGVKAGKIIGVGNGILNKSTGWLSHIIVSNDYQNQGIGYKLTERVIELLDGFNCQSQLLIATKMGEGLYAKLGFKTTGIYKFFEGNQLSINPNYEYIRPFEDSDFEKLIKLDFEISGEYREHMIKDYTSDGRVSVKINTGELNGYFLPELGDGVILAKSNDAGIELLKLKHHLKKCKTILPEENKSGEKFLIENGFEMYNQARRMVFGNEVKWQPQFVFCRIGGFYG